MNKLLPSLILAALLTACGGGGDSPAPATPTASAAPAPAAAAPAPAPAPTAAAPVLYENPPPAPGGNFGAGTMNVNGSNGSYPTTFNNTTNLNVTGNGNTFWLTAAAPGGTVIINGSSNTVVFRPSSTPSTVTVTGSINTFYLPEGSPIKLEGTGAASSVIKFYKPA